MTEKDRGPIGLHLKRLRTGQGLKQQEIATKAGMSIGTVQAIEYNKYRVDISNIEKYAAAVGTTIQKILHPETTVRASDSLLTDLNREHLTIARLYMRAMNVIRLAVEVLLRDQPEFADIATDIAHVVLLLKAAADQKPQIAFWTQTLLVHGDLVEQIARRIDRDPLVEVRLRELLNEPPNPLPGAPKGKTK